MAEQFFTFLIAGLACYRLTRFIVADKIFDFPRAHVNHFLTTRNRRPFKGIGNWLAGLINCGYCSSVWIAAGLTWAIDVPLERSVPLPALWSLALGAFAVGYWNVTEPDDD